MIGFWGLWWLTWLATVGLVKTQSFGANLPSSQLKSVTPGENQVLHHQFGMVETLSVMGSTYINHRFQLGIWISQPSTVGCLQMTAWTVEDQAYPVLEPCEFYVLGVRGLAKYSHEAAWLPEIALKFKIELSAIMYFPWLRNAKA